MINIKPGLFSSITSSTVIALIVLAFQSTAAFSNEKIENALLAGKNIYLHGKLSSGKDVIATTVGDVLLNGEKAACANCHKRSGLGSNEGSTVAPPVTGEILFSEKKIKAHRFKLNSTPSPSALDRPAYTKDSLKHTLLSGEDNNGHKLKNLMPRYTLTETDYNNLYSYLNSLSNNDIGVSDDTLHIATIIDGRASTDKSNMLINILEKYISELNAQTRHEIKRLKHSPIQKEWHYQSYRKIKLHTWKLSGEPDSWINQLNNYYELTPVFAITYGISKDSWGNIDKFCNIKEIPCILPNTLTPGDSKENFYTLYFSSGPHNDAYVLASHLNNIKNNNEEQTQVLQLYDRNSYNITAQNIIHNELTSDNTYSIKSISLNKISKQHAIAQYIKNKKTTIIIWSETISDYLLSELVANLNNIKTVFIPYYLAYGETGSSVIPPKSNLIFEVEILEILN